MDIKSLSSVAVNTAAAVQVRPVVTQEEVSANRNEPVSNVTALNSRQNARQDDKKEKDEVRLSKQEVVEITDGLNEFMAAMNTDIKFVLHTKMKELVVQVVDNKSHKVLRESPPKELLDTLARIRDFVGSLLDKKA